MAVRLPPPQYRQANLRMETEPMSSPTTSLRARIMLCAALGMAAVLLAGTPRIVDAQGLVKGVEKGAREGNKAAGPVGGVLGGAIGGVVGVVNGGLRAGQGQPAQQQQQPENPPAANP